MYNRRTANKLHYYQCSRSKLLHFMHHNTIVLVTDAIMTFHTILRRADHPARPKMSFNQIIRVGGGFPTGRSIGAGRDKSGPTGCRVRLQYPCYFVTVHHRPLRLSGLCCSCALLAPTADRTILFMCIIGPLQCSPGYLQSLQLAIHKALTGMLLLQ